MENKNTKKVIEHAGNTHKSANLCAIYLVVVKQIAQTVKQNVQMIV